MKRHSTTLLLIFSICSFAYLSACESAPGSTGGPSADAGSTDTAFTADTGTGDTGSTDTGSTDTATGDTATGDTATGDAATDPGSPDGGGSSTWSGLGILDKTTVCTLPDRVQISFSRWAWNGGSATVVTEHFDGEVFAGTACCVDGLDTSVAAASSAYDLGADLPPSSYLDRLYVPVYPGAPRHFLTFTAAATLEGGVTKWTNRLAFWKESAQGSCTFVRGVETSATPPSSYFLPQVAGVAGVDYALRGSEQGPLVGLAMEPGDPTPSWGQPTVLLPSCPVPEDFLACASHPGARYRAFLVRCGTGLQALRTEDGRSFQATALKVPGFAAGTRPATCVTAGDALHLVWSERSASQERYLLNVLDDDGGPWSKPRFASSPAILSADLSSSTERLRLSHYWPEGGTYWASFELRLGKGEMQTGSTVYFGRSDGGSSWTFDKDTSCPTRRCFIPHFLIAGGGYVYYKAIEETGNASRLKAVFFQNVGTGDPTQPMPVGLSIPGLTNVDNPDFLMELHRQGETVGFLYWKDWDFAAVPGGATTTPKLVLQRFRLLR